MNRFNILWQQTRAVIRSTNESFKIKEHDALDYMKTKRNQMSDVHQRLKQSTKDSAKHQFRQLPRYTYQVTKTGIKYSWYIGKAFLNHTPPGKYLKGAAIIYFGCRMAYVYGTYRVKDITVHDKFWRYDDNEQDSVNGYMITDHNNNIYKVTNSLWFFQPYSTETWSSLKAEHKYKISMYGIRLAAIGVYPNVIRVRSIE